MVSIVVGNPTITARTQQRTACASHAPRIDGLNVPAPPARSRDDVQSSYLLRMRSALRAHPSNQSIHNPTHRQPGSQP